MSEIRDTSNYKNTGIKIGHLYDLNPHFMNMFFVENWRSIANKTLKKRWKISSVINQSIQWQYFGSTEESAQVPVYSLSEEKLTYAGPGLIVDEYKSGRAKIYQVYIAGEERYFTENQLRYAEEIK